MFTIGKIEPNTARIMLKRTTSLFLAIGLLGLSACDLPKDQRGTLKQVEGGTLRIGLVGSKEQQQQELAKLDSVAAGLNAQLQYVSGETHTLVDATTQGDIHLLVSLPSSTPFEQELGLTRSYQNSKWKDPKRVWAVRSGENSWLMRLNRELGASP